MAILFDLDGTLLDSAPDFLITCNKMRERHNIQKKLTYEQLTPYITKGMNAITGCALEIVEDHPQIHKFAEEGLKIYHALNYKNSVPFLEIEDILQTIEKLHIPWGIVTNRSHEHAFGVVERVGWKGLSCLVSRDTTNFAKPNPKPLLHACKILQVVPRDCWYVGDDDVDIQAAQNAGIRAIGVLYGYGSISRSSRKYITHIAETPKELHQIIKEICLA